MADTTFIDRQTPIYASWLNDVNRKTYFENVSVKNFGAKGDGVTDDTAAIQAAVNSAILNSSGLYFPAGTYVLTSQINLTFPFSTHNGIVLYGELNGTTFKINHAGNGFVIDKSGTTIDQGTRVVFSNLSFTSGDVFPATAILNKFCVNLLIRECHFYSMTVTSAVVKNQTAYGLDLDHCTWRGITGKCVYFQQSAADATYSFVSSISYCDFSFITGTAVYLEGGNGLTMIRTIMQVCQKAFHADVVAKSSVAFNLSFINCWFEQNVDADIDLPSNVSFWSEAKISRCNFGFRALTLGGTANQPALINLGAKSKIVVDGIVFGGVSCQITGSANASAILIGTTGFTPVGTFAVTLLSQAGAFTTPYQSNDAAGNIVAAQGAFISATGSTSAATGVATTIFALPTTGYNYTYIVSAQVSSGPPAAYSAVYIVTSSGLSWRATAMQTATNLTVSVTGTSLQAAQTSGATNPIAWTVTRLS